MHLLEHAVDVMKKNSTLRGTSVRAMERQIGQLKRIFKARINVGENINNILQRQALLNFIKNTKMMSFESAKDRKATPYKASSFLYHPSLNESNRAIMAQLWAPISPEFYFDVDDLYVCQDSLKTLVKMDKFIPALKACKKRLLSSSLPLSSININFDQVVQVAGKAWQQDVVYTSSFAKLKQSTNKLNRRGGEYVMFTSCHTRKRLVSHRRNKVKSKFSNCAFLLL